MLFYVSPSLAVLSLCLIPPVALSGLYYGRYVQGQQTVVQRALAKTMEIAEESIGNFRVVKHFAQEDAEAQRFDSAVASSYAYARRIGVVAAYFDGAVHMAANIGLIAVLWHGSNLVATGALTAGGLTSFLMYSVYTGFNISGLSNVFTELKRASGALQRIHEVIERVPAPAAGFPPSSASASASATALAKPTIKGDIQFRNVTFSYASRPHAPVLNSFNLHVPAGKSIALVGASGGGKSTVAALLLRMYDVEGEGCVVLDGADVKTIEARWLRQHIATVSQEPVLFCCSIADNIRYARPSASDEDVRSAALLANAHEFISKFPEGYDTVVGERGVQLSGGQKQRVAIARAFLKNAPVLILDEATSALDAESEEAVQVSLRELMKGRTVMTIAHRLSTMKGCDLVAVMEGGKVVEAGEFNVLFADSNSSFRALVERQLHM